MINRRNNSRIPVSESGLSVAELLIAAGISAVVMSIMATVIVAMNREMVWFNIKYDYEYTKSQMELAFHDESSCRGNLNGIGLIAAGPTPITSVNAYDANGVITTTLVPALGLLPNSRITITSMALTNPADATKPPALIKVSETAREWSAMLVVKATHNVEGAAPLQDLRIGGIRLVTDPTGAIIGCRPSEGTRACITGSYNKITDTTAKVYWDVSLNPTGAWTNYFVKINAGDWGIQCKNASGWYSAGCTASSLQRVYSTLDATLKVETNGCTADSANAGASSTIYLTCCKTL